MSQNQHSSTHTNPSDPPSLGELVARVSENVSGLVRGELALAQAKAKKMATNMGVGAALLAVAGVLALYGLGFLFDSGAQAISLVLPLWAGKLIVAIVLFMIAGILALVGKGQLEKGQKNVPDPQVCLRQDADTLKQAVTASLKKEEQK